MELFTSKVLDVCTGIGRLMLENGAETYRVEDTIYRVAVNYGMQGVSVFSVPTALIITLQDQTGNEYTRLRRVTEQRSNLGTVVAANNLSRKIATADITPNEALDEIDRLERLEPTYTLFEEFIAVIFISFNFAIIFQGTLWDAVAAGIAGGMGHLLYVLLIRSINIRFFSEILASMVIGWVAVLLINYGVGNDLDVIIVSGVMTLVPGKAITNGIRDLMASHFISGVSVLSDALLTAAAIGIGITTVLSLI